MKKKINVLFAAFEVCPFIQTGGLGDVAGSLPQAINNTGFEVRVIMPKLSQIGDEYVEKMEYLCNFTVPLGWRKEYCGLFKLVLNKTTYYFLDNEHYFKRGRIYGEFDDGERVAFYSKAVLESIIYLTDFAPDIIHANDWHAALIPVFLREHYQSLGQFQNIKTVFTIHNLKFQGQFSRDVIGDVCGLNNTPAESQLLQDEYTANYLLGGATYADWVTTVSPTYAEEICMPYFGEGLDWLFNKRKGNSLSGILNGIDYNAYNPEKDGYICQCYSKETLDEKVKNKLALQEELGLEVNEDIPLFVIVSRLTEQKGLDLVVYQLQKIAELNMQLVVLGVGDQNYEEAFAWYAYNYPNKIVLKKEFNLRLSHKLYAAADITMVPSRFEPCGLTQMIAMHYGSLPLVRETGGLKDTVNDDNGFTFKTFNADDFLNAVYRCLILWQGNKAAFRKKQIKAISGDYSWKEPAKDYRDLYKKLLGE